MALQGLDLQLLQCWSSLLRGDGQRLRVHHFTVYSGSCGDGKEPQNVWFGLVPNTSLLFHTSCSRLAVVYCVWCLLAVLLMEA